MRAYEAMFVLHPNLDEQATLATIEKFTGLIQAEGGEMESVEKWGKRRLAYEVKDLREGYYVLVTFKGEAKTAQELERVFKITDEVLLHLVIRREK
ncbi:MAG: 30S ribosomal protein S6 [Firmicutes bacterium]|nr:30S ribosomal protein S6 [Bacillota bacterium]MCL5040523.1 30S ribosomal protein S6 [Bacillota bacterium]